MNIKLIHVGVAVDNLEDTLRLFEKLFNVKAGDIKYSPDGTVKAAMMDFENGSGIEFIQPLGAKGPLANSVKEKGIGIHHICLKVDNVDEALNMASQSGFKLLHEKSRPSAMFEHHQIGFVDPKSTKGIMVEFLDDI